MNEYFLCFYRFSKNVDFLMSSGFSNLINRRGLWFFVDQVLSVWYETQENRERESSMIAYELNYIVRLEISYPLKSLFYVCHVCVYVCVCLLSVKIYFCFI